jgi:hypothetical protein
MSSEVAIFENSISMDIKMGLLRSFMTAKKALTEVLGNTTMLTDSHFYTNLRPHLWSYAVSRQLSKITDDPDATIVADYIVVNHYNKKVVILNAENTIMTFHKTKEDNMLPSGRVANYMKNYANSNGADNRQLILSSIDPKHYDPPYYGMIVYGINNDDFSHISIVMPDSDVKNIRKYIPIYGSNYNYSDSFVYNEKQLAQLKDEIYVRIKEK